MCEKCTRRVLIGKFEEMEYKLSNFIKFVEGLSEKDLKDIDIEFRMKRVRELSDIISNMK